MKESTKKKILAYGGIAAKLAFHAGLSLLSGGTYRPDSASIGRMSMSYENNKRAAWEAEKRESEAEQQELSAIPTISYGTNSATKSSGVIWKSAPAGQLSDLIMNSFGISTSFSNTAVLSTDSSQFDTSFEIKFFGRSYQGVSSFKQTKIASKPELIRSGKWDSLIEYRDQYGCAAIYIKKGNRYLYFLHDGKKSIGTLYYQLNDNHNAVTEAMKGIGMIAIGNETLKREMRSLGFPLGG